MWSLGNSIGSPFFGQNLNRRLYKPNIGRTIKNKDHTGMGTPFPYGAKKLTNFSTGRGTQK